MSLRDPVALVVLVVAAGCSGDGESPTRAPLGPAEESAIVFQAVDAGTGAALADTDMKVRYLVRAPITLDAAQVQDVASTDPYRIRHEVAEDSLVVEVRLEAPSYHRLDTVLAVGRGGEAGPFTLRMTRRLERTASRPAPAAARPSSGGGQPAAGTPEPSTPAGGSSFDRAALQSGDRAFGAERWLEAIQAYQRMRLPEGASNADMRAYQQGRVRQGVSHMNVGEYAGALDALEEAVGLGLPSAEASLKLAEAQCAVGRIEDGHRTLSALERSASGLDPGERPAALAVAQYVSALCGVTDLDRAEGAIQRVRVGNRIIQELQGFLDRASGVSPRTDLLDQAVADAEARIEEIRDRMRRGG